MDSLSVPNEYTKRLANQSYDYSDAVKINKLITSGFVNGLDIQTSDVDQKFNRGTLVKTRFCQKIFYHFIKVMLEHCIENSHVFISPCKDPFSIHIKSKTQKTTTKTLKKKGLYADVDLFETDFKLYEFWLYSAHIPAGNLGVRIGHTMYKQLVKKLNQGMKYEPLNKFFMDTVIHKVYELYPNLDEDIIKAIVREGFYKMNIYLKLNREIYLKARNLSVQMIIYHPFKEHGKN